MKVRLIAKGVMGKFLGAEPLEVVLPEKARLRDFFEYFDRRLTHKVPEYIWNKDERRFRGPVVVTVDRKVTRDPETVLEEDQEIALFKALVGG